MSTTTDVNSKENHDNMVLINDYSDRNINNNNNSNNIATLDDNETDSDSDKNGDESDAKLPMLRAENDPDSDDSSDAKDPYMDEWQCIQCTLIQHISYRICDACGNPAPKLSPWQENMITEWDNMGDCVFYDTIMDICNDKYDINLNNKQEFDEFVIKLESLGIKSDHSKSRAIAMLEMILAQNNTNKININKSKKNYNPSAVMVKNALDVGMSLKQWMKHNQIWEKNLFLTLVEFGVTEIPHHLYLIDSWHTFHEIVRKVRVLRKNDLKSTDAQQRLDKLCTKFEKLWKYETGYKLTSIKSSKITAKNLPKNVFVNSNERRIEDKKLRKIKKKFAKKKKARTRSAELLEKKGKPLKQWMQKNNIWQLTLYQQLLTVKETQSYLYDPQLMLTKLSQNIFDEISRKVRVERFSQLKDNKARLQCDKILLRFEKLWRKASGIKKTSLR